MKYLIFSILFFFIIQMKDLKAQAVSKETLLEYAQNLERYNFITNKDLEILEKRVDQHIHTSKNELLKFLMECDLNKITGKKMQVEIDKDTANQNALVGHFAKNIYTQGIPRRVYSITTEDAYKEAISNIQKIYKIGLIEKDEEQEYIDRVANLFNKDNSTNTKQKLIDWYDVLTYIIEKKDFENSFQAKTFQEYPQKLEGLGLLLPESKTKLLKAIQANQIRFKTDLLPFLENQVTFFLTKISQDKEVGYETIFKAVFQLFPQYRYQGLKLNPNTKDDNDTTSLQTDLLQLMIGDEFINLDMGFYQKNESNGINFMNIEKINRFLAIQNDKYRLFYLDFQLTESHGTDNSSEYYSKYKDSIRIGFMKLNQNQYNALRKNNNKANFQYRHFNPFWYELYTDSYSNAFKLLNSSQVTQYISQINEVGLLNHLSKEYLKSKTDSIYDNEFTSFQDVLLYLDEESIINIDWEMRDGNKPYQFILLEFSKLTKGYFQPTDIIDEFNFDNEDALIGFTFKGKKYQTKVKSMGDWYNEGFLDLIQKAMNESGADRKFYTLFTEDQISTHIFLNKLQYDFLKSNQLLKFSSDD